MKENEFYINEYFKKAPRRLYLYTSEIYSIYVTHMNNKNKAFFSLHALKIL